jgi:N-methylhydantoinase A
MAVAAENVAEMETIFRDMESDGKAGLAKEAVMTGSVEMRRSCGIRYVGQSWELAVDLASGPIDLAAYTQAFHQAHEQRYGHSAEGDPLEIVNFRLAVIGVMSKPSLPEWTVDGSLDKALIVTRDVLFDGAFAPTPVYDRMKLPKDAEIPGPAIVEESGSVTIVPPGWRCTLERFGVLILTKGY